MTSSRTVSVPRAVLGGGLAHHPGRLALSIGAIALGVALGFAVALVNASAVAEFEGAMKTLAGQADLEVRGPRMGFDEQLYATLARDPDIAVASPVVEVDARLEGRDESLRIYGVDAFRAAAVTPSLVGSADDPLDLLRPGVIFITPAASAEFGVKAGGTIDLQTGLRAVSLRIAGLVPTAAGERYAVMDIATAQDTFARDGSISRIDLRLRPGVAIAVVRARIARALPPGVMVAAPADNAEISTRMSRAYRVNLGVLALVALFTGGLLVFSTQALSVVHRRAQFALLRTLGLTRARLEALVVAEGVLVGTAGSIAGLAAGYALAYAVLRLFGADLGAGYFRGVAPTLVLDFRAALTFALLGIGIAAAGSLLPAREAARARPAAALKTGDEVSAFERLRSPVAGIALLAAGVAMTALPAVAGLPLFGYLAIATLLVGTLLLLPQIAALVFNRLPALRAAPVALAFAQLKATPGHAAVSVATIVASVSLMVSMAVMVTSFRQSLDDWLIRVLPADMYLRAASAGDSAFLSPQDQASIAAVAGVRRIAFLRVQSVVLDPVEPRVALLARDLPADDPGAALPLVSSTHPRASTDPPPAWVSEAFAERSGARPGTRIELPIAGRLTPFVVAGVWRDYARQQGAIVIERATYAALTGDNTATDAALWLAPGTNVAQVRDRLEAALPGAARLAITTPGEIRALSLRIFDRTFAVTYALLVMAIIIGLTGLSSAFGTLVLARRREFGVLRHVGMTRSQVAAMLATEGLVLSGLGLAVGLLLGFAVSLILVHVVNRQSFHWSMSLHVPWGALAGLAVGLLAAAMATTVASARQAMSGDVIRAVKDDW